MGASVDNEEEQFMKKKDVKEEDGDAEKTSSSSEDDRAHPKPETDKKDSNETNKEETWTYHSLIDVVRLWADNTSVHGVRYAFDPDFFPWKHIAWSALVTAMAIAMVLATVALVSQYAEYNTKTSTTSFSPARLPFPEVTVCNTNPVQRSLQRKYNITFPRNETEVNLISQSLEDFMLQSYFNNFSYFEGLNTMSQNADASNNLKSNWRPVITPGGRCWAFLTNETVSVPGQNGGLAFMVDLQQYEYTPSSVSAGITFYVAQPGTQIVSQMTLDAASPGGVAAVTFQANEVRLERREPWSSCTGEAPEYTQYLCREECHNRAIAQSCGCRPMGDVQSNLKNLSYCGPREILCVQNQTSLFAYENCNCTRPPCRELLFPVKSTQARMARRFQRSIENYLNVTENYMTDNIVFMSINYDSMIQHVVEETRVQGPYDLMAALGGVTGLYMGVSLISIVEIFGELFGLRMIPRLWGDTRLYGVGGRS